MITANSAGVGVEFDTIFPCEEAYVPPTDDELATYDGCAFTGSSYSAYDDNVDVHRQVYICGQCAQRIRVCTPWLCGTYTRERVVRVVRECLPYARPSHAG
jgi:hypothetical protein